MAYRRDAESPLSQEERTIMEYLKKKPLSTMKEISQGTGLDRYHAFYELSWLHARGLVSSRKIDNPEEHTIDKKILGFFVIEK